MSEESWMQPSFLDSHLERLRRSLESHRAQSTESTPVQSDGCEKDSGGEYRVTDQKTGGQKGQKTARFDLIPTGPLWSLAVHYGKGALKYEDRNWEKGYDWSLSYAAAQRHLNLFWSGEEWEDDPVTGIVNHLDAAMFHIMALREFSEKYLDGDDRP